jgi:mannose-6-phosphate isomerase-like protein (cupin superfamily)
VYRPCGYHKPDHWIILRGVPNVTVDGAVRILQENESIYVPVGVEHRLRNS